MPGSALLRVKDLKNFQEKGLKEYNTNLMTTKFAAFLLAVAFALPVSALAQTGSTSAALPAAPSAANSAPNAAEPALPAGGNRVGTINIEQAIFASNEGQRDFNALNKKLEPKQAQLKGLNDEVESLKKQLNTQGDKLSEDARANLVKEIEQKQKSLERSVQDARDDMQGQQNEIAQRILQKMAPIIVKYAGDKGFGVIMDTSNPWPQGPVLWAGPSVDITRAIVDEYNVQSGVPAPPQQAAPAKPGASGAKSAPSSTKPQTSAPPKQ